MKVINASIDLTKIDRSKINEHKNGAKYYNIGIIISDEKNNFGQDVSIFDEQSKEDRAAKKPKKYLGNGKIVFDSNTNKETEQKKQTNDDFLF